MVEPRILTYYSSQTETLLDSLFFQLKNDEHSSVNHPFKRTKILVPNSGMQRYLELEIAKYFGICSHIDIMYVGQFISDAYLKLLNESPTNQLDERLLTFALLRLWNKKIVPLDSTFDKLHGLYRQPRQKYLWANKIAKLLRQYLRERPEMIDAWQIGKLITGEAHEIWQRDIFRQLLQTLNKKHCSRLMLQQRFISASAKASNSYLTSAIHIFGFHSMPVSQLTDLLALGQTNPIIFYTFNPSIEYWLDIVPEKFKNRLEIDREEEAELMTIGHPLLASWGQSGKYYIEQLNEFYAPNLDELVEITPPHSILTWLQNDIRTLSNEETDILAIAQTDLTSETLTSISLHVCASPRREVEVLHDNLCQIFEKTTINPVDVLVIVPKLNDYAPHIQAVFSRLPNQPNTVPYSLANQSSAETDPDVQAFLSLLAVINADFQASFLFEALSEARIQEALGLEQSHVDTLRNWFAESHFSLHFYDNSDGKSSSLEKLIDSLLLSAFGGETAQLGTRQATPIYNSGQQEQLTQFCQLWQKFAPFSSLKKQRLTLSDWREKLRELAASFLPIAHAMDNWLNDWYEAIEDIDDKHANYDFTTVTTDLSMLLQNDTLHGPFLSGGVSFCAMMPMRSIPAKMIAVLGLNNDFPSIALKDPLDLSLKKPRWSDRNPHREQQYFFLETLMAAREKFYLSYVGTNEKTGEEMPPSSLVRELMSYIDRHLPQFTNKVKTNYPLQGFLSQYSYQVFYESPKISRDLPASLETETRLPDTLNAKMLVDILVEPLSAFLCYHLGADSLDKPVEALAEHEFITTEDGLDNWHYQQSALAQAQESDSDTITSLQQRNLYAPPVISQALLSKANDDIAPLLDTLSSLDLSTPQSLEETFKYRFNDASLYLHTKANYFENLGLVNYHTGKLNPKKYLTTWIEHIFHHSLTQSAPCPSTLITVDKRINFKAFTNRKEALSALNELLYAALLIIQKPYILSLHFSNKKAETIMHYEPIEISIYPKLAETEIANNTDLESQWKIIDSCIKNYEK